MEVINNDCPFDPDKKAVMLNETDLNKLILSATGSVTAAATLLSIAMVKERKEYTIEYLRDKMFEGALIAIAEENDTDFDTVFEMFKRMQ